MSSFLSFLKEGSSSIRKRFWCLCFIKGLIIVYITLIYPLSFSPGASASNNNLALKLKSAQGYVQVRQAPGEKWQTARPGITLSFNYSIRTLIDSKAELEYPDGTLLTLRENSILDIKDISADPKTGKTKRELKLDVGGMKYKITPLRQKASEFKIYSSTAIVGVTGTEGIIFSEGEGKPTKNILLEGATFNTDEKGLNGRPLSAGNAWQINENATFEKHALTEDEKAPPDFTEENKEIIARYESLMRDMEARRAEGYEIDEKIFRDMEDFIIKKDYKGAKELLERAETLLKNLKRAEQKKARLFSEINALKSELAKKAKDGYDTQKLALMIYEAGGLADRKDYKRSSDIIQNARGLLASLTSQNDNFPRRLERLMDEINGRAKAGFIITESAGLAKKARLMYESGLLPEAESFLLEAKEALFQAKREIPQDLIDELKNLKEMLSEKRENGYETMNLSKKLAEAQRLLKGGLFKQSAALISDIKAALPFLKKGVPKDMLLLLKEFEAMLDKKKRSGYDTSVIQDTLIKVRNLKESGDYEALRPVLTEAIKDLKALPVPVDISNRLKALSEKCEESIARHPLYRSDILNLKSRVESEISKENLKEARRLLDELDKLLAGLKDTSPPTLQLSDLRFKKDRVVCSGIARDNVAIDYITINGGVYYPDKNGAFSAELLFNPTLKEISVQARDKEGNLSPEIMLAIPEEKLKELKDVIPEDPELRAEDIQVSYTQDEVILSGITESGAMLTANGVKAQADADGNFTISINASRQLVEDGVTLVSKSITGMEYPAVKLNIEDRWRPVLNIEDFSRVDNTPPVLTVKDLSYTADSVIVEGTAVDYANIYIKGEARDIGLGIEKIEINNASCPQDNGIFSYSLLLNPDLKSVIIEAQDKAGNTATAERTLPSLFLPVKVRVNGEDAPADGSGNFSKTLPLTKGLKEITIEAEDASGNAASSVTLIVIDRIPPELMIGDILYDKDSVTITGQTEPFSTIYDKTGALFNERVDSDASGLFSIKKKRPAAPLKITLIAEDASGNTSEGTDIEIAPLEDTKPPMLIVSNLDYKAGSVVVSGSVEDDTKIKSVTINGEPVELDNGYFRKELPLSPDLVKIVVVATDVSGKTTTEERITEDHTPPSLSINDPVYENGYCIVTGNCSDNIGVREVRVNNIPVYLSSTEGGTFECRMPLTPELLEVKATAVDLYGNIVETEAKKVTPPPDNAAPILRLNELEYSGTSVIVSGSVYDDVGIKAVYINNEPVPFYEDAGFKKQVEIGLSSPDIDMSDPAYTEGLVVISGNIIPPEAEPDKVKVNAEDLSGNMSGVITRDIDLYAESLFSVEVNGESVETEGLKFNAKVILEKGMSSIKVLAKDEITGRYIEKEVELEKIPPVLEIKDPVYENDSVIISGNARDSGSGLSEVLVNGSSVDFDDDGNFSTALPLTESVASITAIDRLGNTATGAPVEITPPDVYPPLFLLQATPVPALVGKDITINIDAVDSNSRLPDILKEPPLLTVQFSDGTKNDVPLSGSGASFFGVIKTEDKPAGLIVFSVKGIDEAGNEGHDIEGVKDVLLNSRDTTPPSFVVTLDPAIANPGKDIKIMIKSSETLKKLPNVKVMLPGNVTLDAVLEGPPAGTEFSSSIAIPAETLPGMASVRLEDAIDLAENKQGNPVIKQFEIRPKIASMTIPLYIEFSELTPENLRLRGNTIANGIVHIEGAGITADIPSDANGLFEFMKSVSVEDIKSWKTKGNFIRLTCIAKNYANLQSDAVFVNLPVPSLRQVALSKGALNIDVLPDPLEQGKEARIMISSESEMPEPPRVIIRLADGSTKVVAMSGRGTAYEGVFKSDVTAVPGPAVIEARSGELSGFRPYAIVSGYGNANVFFNITANPDPLPQGAELHLAVTSDRPLDKIPELILILPDGKNERISLSGTGSSFTGKYLCPENTMPGPAELILNPGGPDEFRRPFGISPKSGAAGQNLYSNIFASSNPMPMVAGKEASVIVTSGEKIDFIPIAEIVTSNGRIITVRLKGDTPGNYFRGTSKIPEDVQFGPATIIIRDKNGSTIGRFPTGITPGIGTRENAEVTANMIPQNASPGDPVTINVSSISEDIKEMPGAKLIFSDGSILPIALQGAIPGRSLNAAIAIPPAAPEGPVNIVVIDASGKTIGGGHGYIERKDRIGKAGRLDITLTPQRPSPGDRLQVSLYSELPVIEIPAIKLEGPNLRPVEFHVNGNVPGNNFTAEARLPRRMDMNGAVINIMYNTGLGEEREIIPLEGPGTQEGAPRPPELNPNPPIPGKPLTITLYAPFTVNFVPSLNVVYTDNSREPVPLSGPVPGDRFTGTLASVKAPVTAIEVFDNEGNMVESLPLEVLGRQKNMPPPRIDIMPQPVAPGIPTDIHIGFPSPVSSLPYARLMLPDGKTINIVLNGPVPGVSFNGIFTVPPGSLEGQATVEVLIDNEPVPGGRIPLFIGEAPATGFGNTMNLVVYPGGRGKLILEWQNPAPEARKYKIICEAPGTKRNTFEVGSINKYSITGLETQKEYRITLIAFDRRGRELARSEQLFFLAEGGDNNSFPLYTSPAGPGNIQVNWDYIPGVSRYLLRYAPGGDDLMSRPPVDAGPSTGYLISGLSPQRYQVQVEAVRANGENIFSELKILNMENNMDMGRPPIELLPPIPVVNQPLEINVVIPMITPVAPRITAVYLNHGEEDFIVSGATPGNTFHGRIATVKDEVVGINFYNPVTGELAHSEPISAAPRPMGLPPDIHVSISVYPEPPVKGQDLNISLDFNMPVDFYAAGLRLLVEFRDGKMLDVPVPPGPPSTHFTGLIPASEHTSDINIISVEGERIIPDEFINTALTGGIRANIYTVPDIVAPGMPFTINVETIDAETGAPVSIDKPPVISVEFLNDTEKDYPPQGAVPGSKFYVNVPAGDVIAPLRLIEVSYEDVPIGTKLFEAGPAGPVQFGPRFSPEPPIIGQPLNLILDIPPEQAMLTAPPEVRIIYDQGVPVANEVMTVTGEVPGRHFEGVLNEVKGKAVQADFIDLSTGSIVFTYPFASSGNVPMPPGGELMLAPAIPPPGTNVDVLFRSAEPLYDPPIFEVWFRDNSTRQFTSEGPVPGTEFRKTIFIPYELSRIEVWDKAHTLMLASKEPFYGPGPSGGEIHLTPYPPEIGKSLTIEFNSYGTLYEYPGAILFFVSGAADEIDLNNGDLPGTSFSAETTEPLSDNIERVEIWDHAKTNMIAEMYLGAGPGGPVQFGPQFSPDPPVVGEPLSLILEIPDSEPAIQGLPEIRVNYSPGVDPPSESMQVSGDVPGRHFEATLSQIKGPVESVDFINPSTGSIEYTHFFSPVTAPNTGGEISASPMPPELNQPVYVEFKPAQSLYEYPIARVYYASNSFMRFPLENGALPGDLFSATSPGPVTEQVDRIEVWDNSETTMYAGLRVEPSGSALHDAAPVISISPDPPVVNETLQINIDASLDVALPYIQVWYTDGSSEQVNLSGNDPGMNFTASINPLTRPVDRIELFAGPEDPYPHEFVVARYFSTGELPYPKNIWLESTSVNTEVAVHWDSVPEGDGYYVYYSLSSPAYKSSDYVQVSDRNITREVITGLLEGYTYYFTVSAFSNDGRESAYEKEIPWVIGSGISGGGALNLIEPSDMMLDFGTVPAGTTSGSLNITIENKGSSTATIKKDVGNLTNIFDMVNLISSDNIDLQDGLTLAAGSSITIPVSVDVPAGSASGDYLTIDEDELKLFNDANGDGIMQDGESFVRLQIKVTVGTEGLKLHEGGVDFEPLTAPGQTQAKTVHIENISSANMTNMTQKYQDLFNESDNSRIIPSSNIIFNINSSVAGVLAAGEVAPSTIYIDVPAGTEPGIYHGALPIYNDSNLNGALDGDEPFVSLLIEVVVQTDAQAILDHFEVTHDGIAVVNEKETIKVVAKDANGDTITDYTPVDSLIVNFNGVSGVFEPDPELTPDEFANGEADIMFIPDYEGSCTITVNDERAQKSGTSTALTVVAPPAPVDHFAVTHDGNATVNVAEDITVTAKDIGGNTVYNYSPVTDVSLSVAGAQGSFSKSQLTSQDFVNGEANVQFTPASTGSANITATDNTNNAITGTSGVLVIQNGSGVFDHFKVAHDGDAIVGVAELITVYAQDINNATVTDYVPATSASLSLNNLTGTFNVASLYPQDFQNGTATFDFTPDAPGSGTITVTDVSSGKSGESPLLNVSQTGPVTHFVLTYDGASEINSAEPITITAKDSQENTVTSYTPGTSVSMSLNGISGSFDKNPLLPADFTNGEATVNFTPDATGSGTITATDDSDNSITGSLDITVSSSTTGTITNLNAVDRGIGGTVDLTWGYSGPEPVHFHIYYSTSPGNQTYGTPQETTDKKAYQVTGLADNTSYYFVVRSSGGESHSPQDPEEQNTNEVLVTPTLNTQGDITPPTFSGIKRAYATGKSGEVAIEFQEGTDISIPLSYYIYYSADESSVFSTSRTGPVANSPATVSNLIDGTTYYFGVRAIDAAGNEEKNTAYESATPYANVDHVTLTAVSEEKVGTPVLVQVTAYSSQDDSVVNTSFNDSVNILAWENTASQKEHFILSLKDRVTDDEGAVDMYQGEGFFTVEATTSTVVNLQASGINSNLLTISFSSDSGTSVSQLAMDYSPDALSAGAGANAGSLIRISAVDNSGKVVSNFTDTVTFSITDPGQASVTLNLESGSGTLQGNSYTFSALDNGEAIIRIKDTETESGVSFTITSHTSTPSSATIDFYGVEKYLLESYGQYTINAETVGSRIKFTAYAATSTDKVLSGYNGQANFELISEGIDNNSSHMIPSIVDFKDGKAEFYIEDSEYEDVHFRIKDTTNPVIQSDEIVATFSGGDTTPPQIVRVEAETPFLIHLYFSEEIDSTNAFIETNYQGVGNIDKICWYEDEVTVNLSSPLPLSSSQSITIKGNPPDGIKDASGNYMGDTTEPFTVPNVDYQGSSYGSSDWLEMQVSKDTVPAGTQETIHVMIYHKNACGYLTGSNSINRSADVSTIDLSYTGDTGALQGNPATVDMNNGLAEFDITVNFSSPGQSIQITGNAQNVTSGTATISSN